MKIFIHVIKNYEAKTTYPGIIHASLNEPLGPTTTTVMYNVQYTMYNVCIQIQKYRYKYQKTRAFPQSPSDSDAVSSVFAASDRIAECSSVELSSGMRFWSPLNNKSCASHAVCSQTTSMLVVLVASVPDTVSSSSL